MRTKNKLYNNFTRYFIVHFSILIIAVLFLAGCGKKAPPVPPRQVKLSAVNELEVLIVGNALELTRDIPKKKGEIISGFSGSILHRSVMLSSSDCKNREALLKQITDKPLGCF